jgi:hypothetical protein
LGEADMSELMLLRQMAGGDVWLSVACLLGLFGVVIFRRESIVNWRLFRLSYILLAASIAVPALLLPALNMGFGGGNITRNLGVSGMGPDKSLGLLLLLNGTGPTLLAFCILCAFGSLLPRNIYDLNRPPAAPMKHPLD